VSADHPGPAGAPPPTAEPARPLVLVVDDDWATRQALRVVLVDELDARVVEAEDGEDARYTIMEGVPDVAVIDAKMPWPDGIELIRRMRADAATAEVPIVGISALPVGDRMLQAGCVAFLAKPFDTVELVGAVRRALCRVH
jgi:CheY-like chemotaxis protein